MCNISYPSSEDLTASMPIALRWETQLLDTDLSNQSTGIVGDVYFESVLTISRVNSSYCGTYTCVGIDDHVAQSASDTASVDVGRSQRDHYTMQYDKYFAIFYSSCDCI